MQLCLVQRLSSEYLRHFLRASTAQLLARRVGGAQPNLSQEVIRKLEVPLPPIDEQRRIAAILDQADELGWKRRTSLALLDSLPESVFLDMFGDPLNELVRSPRRRTRRARSMRTARFGTAS